MRRLHGWMLALGVAAAPVAVEARVIERVVAVVNDEIVTWSELEDALGPILRQVEAIPDPITRESQRDKQTRLVLDDVIGQKLISQEAQKRKLNITSGDVDAHLDRVKRQQKWDDARLQMYLSGQGMTMDAFRIQVREQLLRTKVVRSVLGERVRISDGDVEEYYKSKATQALGDVELDGAQVFLPVPAEATPAEDAATRQQLKEIRDRAVAGEDFGELAKSYSKAPGADRGGSIGTLRRGGLDPTFEEAAFGLADGAVSEPIRTSAGWHLIKVLARRKVPMAPLNEVREDLRRELVDQKMKDEVAKWVDDLKQKAFIEVRL